jgi:hypothetical protein
MLRLRLHLDLSVAHKKASPSTRKQMRATTAKEHEQKERDWSGGV